MQEQAASAAAINTGGMNLLHEFSGQTVRRDITTFWHRFIIFKVFSQKTHQGKYGKRKVLPAP
jgi:hypothetical protein